MSTQYNGHKNIQTWNVSLHIGNELCWQSIASRCETYKEFTDKLLDMGFTTTPDGYSWSDEDLDYKALNELINDTKE